ncbi:hypothetical protein OSC27_11690 [Microbacterium sp. STN6]|uniref:hypothetical protein n=1 Tax=Microbacterium sp. STN6 TaxID=2995588 RepID=UPI002260B0EF|nr:hypothetical protein [Microbacterium sp. STN6]MCX7522936.1 hypothetical protein [Microbacterium sp. STN6]
MSDASLTPRTARRSEPAASAASTAPTPSTAAVAVEALHPRFGLLALCLVAAPLAEVVEAVLSPLTGGETSDDMAAIAAAPERFTVSVLIGLVGTVLLLPALLGLSRVSAHRSPTLALFASAAIVVSIVGFAGIRMAQAFELQLSSGGAGGAAHFDAAVGNAIGATMTVMFLAGNVVGIILLAIALLRSRAVPIAAVILLLLFPFVDLLVPGHIGAIASHVVLLAAFGWMAARLLRSPHEG